MNLIIRSCLLPLSCMDGVMQCSCSLVEVVADSTIGIVMPFYSEIKAVLYLFQILTRARVCILLYVCFGSHVVLMHESSVCIHKCLGRRTDLPARHASTRQALRSYPRLGPGFWARLWRLPPIADINSCWDGEELVESLCCECKRRRI